MTANQRHPSPSLRSAALALCLTGAVVLGGSAAAQAFGPTGSVMDGSVTLTPIGTYATGAWDEGASEIVAHDPGTQRVFVVNADAGTIDVLDISDPTQPTLVDTLQAPGANSVAVSQRLVAVAEQAENRQAPGTVALFDLGSLELLNTVTVGALPDMVTFTHNGQYALVAGEGEPEGYCDGQVDPDGTVAVIDVRRGAERASVRIADFVGFNDRYDDLVAAGVRLTGPGASVAQDVEPEYITTDRRGHTAWVSLQENNALAVVDIRSATVTDILPLGTKDHSLAGNALDPSDKDDAIAIAPWPVVGTPMPDGIASYAHRGQDYVLTANEGDAREYDCWVDESRLADLTLDPGVFADAARLRDDEALGRLTVTTTAARSDAGYTQIQSFGARSMSIYTAGGDLVWDSGDTLERMVAAVDPEHFNADEDEFDKRSDNKGPEPEGVVVGKVDGRTLAFVGTERTSGIAVFDVSDPASPTAATYAINRDYSVAVDAPGAGDVGPEGLAFISADDSPTGMPLLVVGNEVSGTTTIWSVTTG